MTITSIIDKIKKLQALAKSTTSAAESASAAAKANALIDEYRIAEAELEVKDINHSEPINKDSSFIYTTGKVTAWRQMLLTCLAKHYGCTMIIEHDFQTTKRKISNFRLIGRNSDLLATRYLFDWLVTECERLSLLEAKGQGRVYIASYCEGFVRGVQQQLFLSRQAAREAHTSAAMVKIDAREEEAQQALKILYPDSYKVNVPNQRQINPNAIKAGYEKGEKIHLGKHLPLNNDKLLGK